MIGYDSSTLYRGTENEDLPYWGFGGVSS